MGSPPPSNLTATAVSETQIDLSWNDNSDNESGFKLERSPGGADIWTQIATVEANVTTYADTELTCETTYDYRVRAYNTSGDSDYSNIATATTLPCPLPEIEVFPTSFEEEVVVGELVTTTLTISNTGPGTLSYSISELETTTSRSTLDMGQVSDSSWLDENPKSGTVLPGEHDEIIVSIDATGLDPEEYSANIVISNNDPDENPMIVPVVMQVMEEVTKNYLPIILKNYP